VMVPDPIPDWYERRQLERRARRQHRAARPKPLRRQDPVCVLDTPDPCWAARCRFSLLKDENKDGVRETHPDEDPAKLQETCALRAARDGVFDGDTFRDYSVTEIAVLLSLSAQGVRLAMLSAFRKIADSGIAPERLIQHWRARKGR
jgi:hypothetical protein